MLNLSPLLGSIRAAFTALAQFFTIPQLIGYGAMFLLVCAAVIKRERSLRRFWTKSFRTDIAYSIWFPIYTLLIGLPLTIFVSQNVDAYFPLVHLRVLSYLPVWLNFVIWILLVDLTIYWLHRWMHTYKWLWALHRVHHSQRDLNPLTTWRTHWLEFVYMNVGTFIVILLLGDFIGYPPLVVGLLAASQFAQHSGINWNYGPMGFLIVSPRFHAWHHSSSRENLYVNFGSLFTIWDHVFGTALRRGDMPESYGLPSPDDDIPRSFLGQQLIPLSTLVLRKRTRSLAGDAK
ncbi:MAG: sterol desaturase family protein [Acidobacteria bacterium]|nr:sterol desaturase family protein [Acidobacteriota bacterium]